MYYDVPFQVIYLRKVNNKLTYRKGIAFHEWIVDAIDGAPCKVKDCIKIARRHGVDEDYAVVESFGWPPIVIS